jgi:hypothetical protein
MARVWWRRRRVCTQVVTARVRTQTVMRVRLCVGGHRRWRGCRRVWWCACQAGEADVVDKTGEHGTAWSRAMGRSNATGSSFCIVQSGGEKG